MIHRKGAENTKAKPRPSPNPLFRLCVLCVLAVHLFICASAAERSALKRPRPAPEVKQLSVEALAEATRRSVVVISHFDREGKEDGVGAGFVVDTNGLIATSLHVIGEARPIQVHFADGRSYGVTEIHAWDRKLDLAVIRISATNLPSLPLGDSDSLKQGAAVVAMGNPLGLKHSIVQGVVSARRDFDGVEMIQLAIPIEPGNSGGPLLDMQGHVHGLLTMKSAMTANLGFAIAINQLKPLLARPNPIPLDRWLRIGALKTNEWTPLFGARWTQKSGRIQAESPGTGFGGRSLCLWQKTPPQRPYELTVSVRLDDEAGAAGLVFGSDGNEKHYGFYPSAGQLRLTRFDGPNVFSWTILEQAPSPYYRRGEWNTLKVRLEKDKIRCFVNDHLAIESDDAGLPDGKIGLAKFRDTKASFKAFEVGASLSRPASALPADASTAVSNALEKLAAAPREKLVAALEPQPLAAQKILSERATQLEQQAGELRRVASIVRRQAVEKELLQVLRPAEEKIDLFHAALLVSKLDNPELDIDSYRKQIDEMAGELRDKLKKKSNSGEVLSALKEYLFSENGFHGSRGDYYNRANSYINDVIDDREGIPITLSVLFLELGRRVGLKDLAGVPLPGHFMVKFAPDSDDDQLIDVFNEGKVITRDQADELVHEYTGGPLADTHLKPAKKREIVIRMLRNLHSSAQRTESDVESLRYLDVILALSPESALDHLDRARLRLQFGDRPGARVDFKWLLDNDPPGIDMDRVAEVFQSL